MRLFFITLLFLFITLVASPTNAQEKSGLKTLSNSYDETGSGEEVKTGHGTVVAVFTGREFKRFNLKQVCPTSFSVNQHMSTTGCYTSAFRRDADRVGLRFNTSS